MRPPLGVGKREDPQIFGAQSFLKEGICLASKEPVVEPIASNEWLHPSDPAAEEENKSSVQPFERRPPSSASDGLHQNLSLIHISEPTRPERSGGGGGLV